VPSGAIANGLLYTSRVRWDRASVLALLPLIDCVSCGECCRTCNPVVVQKQEAEHIPLKLERYTDDLWALPSPCPFRDDGLKMCRIYSHRPVVCKFYPLVRLYQDGDYVVSVAESCEAGRRCVERLQLWQCELVAA